MIAAGPIRQYLNIIAKSFIFAPVRKDEDRYEFIQRKGSRYSGYPIIRCLMPS